MSRRGTALLAMPSTPPQISPIAGFSLSWRITKCALLTGTITGYNGAVKDRMMSESDTVWPWSATVVLRVRARNNSGRSKGTALPSGTQVSPGLDGVIPRVDETRETRNETNT
ncbi:hypothetical protein SPBR_06279 [Sporothrix brasiliensis 5110]|uniref:Uncharacterized protein n=1 Tax=Sporothrix brasiliensis 5110 TaxID=1398154 RepID=A0A0C2J4A0_9PEZI|nr:uncharacterized protein SPBR_06279 [Sporothrix brasiliensis 5110]KIH93850.1 hypothetical protein SPBR_06279 [Sporothrix brasiliensis 5110]